MRPVACNAARRPVASRARNHPSITQRNKSGGGTQAGATPTRERAVGTSNLPPAAGRSPHLGQAKPGSRRPSSASRPVPSRRSLQRRHPRLPARSADRIRPLRSRAACEQAITRAPAAQAVCDSISRSGSLAGYPGCSGGAGHGRNSAGEDSISRSGSWIWDHGTQI
jgi:hypothetical protein